MKTFENGPAHAGLQTTTTRTPDTVSMEHDWAGYGLTMTLNQHRAVRHEARSTFYARIKPGDSAYDPEIPKSFRLTNSPHARQLWWTSEVRADVERRASRFRQQASTLTEGVDTQSQKVSPGPRKAVNGGAS